MTSGKVDPLQKFAEGIRLVTTGRVGAKALGVPGYEMQTLHTQQDSKNVTVVVVIVPDQCCDSCCHIEGGRWRESTQELRRNSGAAHAAASLHCTAIVCAHAYGHYRTAAVQLLMY